MGALLFLSGLGFVIYQVCTATYSGPEAMALVITLLFLSALLAIKGMAEAICDALNSPRRKERLIELILIVIAFSLLGLLGWWLFFGLGAHDVPIRVLP